MITTYHFILFLCLSLKLLKTVNQKTKEWSFQNHVNRRVSSKFSRIKSRFSSKTFRWKFSNHIFAQLPLSSILHDDIKKKKKTKKKKRSFQSSPERSVERLWGRSLVSFIRGSLETLLKEPRNLRDFFRRVSKFKSRVERRAPIIYI